MGDRCRDVIRIRKWKKFQHYKDRNPPWLKLHRSLLNKRNWIELSGDAAKLLIECWMLASGSEHGVIEEYVDEIAWRLRRPKDDLMRSLQELERQGFIEWTQADASASLADAVPETEGEGETETEGETEREREETTDLDLRREEKASEDRLSESEDPKPAPRPDPWEVLEQEKNGSGEKVPVTEEARDALASLLLGEIEERDHPRSTSIPKNEGGQHKLAVRFFAEYFPPTRPGAGFPVHVQQWMGRIPSERLSAAIRELERSVYSDGKGGERGWDAIESDIQKRMIVSYMNQLVEVGAR